MSDTNQKQEDEVLRRMLATKPTPHKPLGKRLKNPREPLGVTRKAAKGAKK